MALPRSGDYGMTLTGSAYYSFANENVLDSQPTSKPWKRLTTSPKWRGCQASMYFSWALPIWLKAWVSPAKTIILWFWPKLKRQIGKIIEGGKIPGIFAGSTDAILKYKRMGVQVFVTSADALIKTVSLDYLKAVRL